jgi:uncharacterized protein involved in exopolysaccharide biosynthesis
MTSTRNGPTTRDDEAVEKTPRTLAPPPAPKTGTNGRAPVRKQIPVRPPARATPARPPWRGWGALQRWLVVALIVLVPTVGAALISASQAPTYAAQADILYRAVSGNSPEAMDQEMATQRLAMTNRMAVEAAANAVGRKPDELAKKVSVEVLDGSNILRLKTVDRSREVARSVTASLALRYTAAVTQRAADRRTAQKASFDQQIAAANARLVAINARLGLIAATGLVPPPTLAAEALELQGEAQVLRQQVVDLQTQSLQWDADHPDAGMPSAEIAVLPNVLPDPVGPQPLRAAAAGALVGLLLAFLLVAFVRRRHAHEDPEAAVARP